jgi:hypothetical protein
MLETVILAAALAAAGPTDASQCAAMSDDARRLACYDALFRPSDRAAPTEMQAGPTQPEAAASAVAVPAAAAPEQDFGLSGQQRAKRDAAEESVDEIRAVVVELHGSRVGKPAYTLDNGQRWRQVEATSRPMFKVGATVVIRKAALGSFMGIVPDAGGAPVRLRREE